MSPRSPKRSRVQKSTASAREVISKIAEHFSVRGRLVDASLKKGGHIHDTFLATYAESNKTVHYIHQRINQHVFSKPEQLMNNIRRVIRHLHEKLARQQVSDIARRTLTLIPARDGEAYHIDEAGCFWRTFLYIEGTKTYNVVSTPALARRAASAFGCFAQMLGDLPKPQLHRTIAHFHDTPRRFAHLCQAVEANTCDRAALVREEIDFALEREQLIHVFVELQSRGELAEHVAHNDTKINNVLFDALTGEALCIIDLDTVMSGLVLHDFGDLVRTCASPSKEDARDLNRVYLRLPVFEALVEGYLGTAGTFLTEREIDLLPIAGKLITFEAGIRFLTDYLEGDVYFKTRRRDHNLDRCRNQFQLLRSMEQQQQAMALATERARRQ